MDIKKPFITRGIKRKFNEILLDGVEVGMDQDFKINPINAEKANDYLVKEMCEATVEDIDELSEKQFEAILKKINSIKSPL